MGAESECSGRDPASSAAHNNNVVGFSPRRSDTGVGGGSKAGRIDTADFLISVAEQAEEENQGSLLGGRMASSQAMQWVGDQQRILPQTDAAVLASSARAQLGPSAGMWQPSSHLAASGIGAAPASAAMATDHPALGFSLLQNRMNPAVKSEPGQAHGPQGAGQSWGQQFSAIPPFSCDYGALNPMPVVPPSNVLSAMNQSNSAGQDFSAGFLPRHAGGQFEPSGSQLFSSSGLLSLPNTFGMSGASSYSALQSSASFDTFSQLTPKSFGADSSMPRPASMPSLLGGPVQFEPGTGMPNPSSRRKGRGGRTAAMDPRLDPSIDPKRAKRILANRLSAARSKSKQRGHLDVLEGAHATLVQQKDELLKEAAWLRAEIKLMEEEGPKLEGQLKALEEHALLQEALQIKLLEECGHQSPFGGDSSATAPGSRPDRHD